MRKAISKGQTGRKKKKGKPKNNPSFISILHQTFMDKIPEKKKRKKSNIWGIDKEDEEQLQTSILTWPIHHIILGKSCEPI